MVGIIHVAVVAQNMYVDSLLRLYLFIVMFQFDLNKTLFSFLVNFQQSACMCVCVFNVSWSITRWQKLHEWVGIVYIYDKDRSRYLDFREIVVKCSSFIYKAR